MQSLLGILNYYHRFIEDLAIYASYELREAGFYEISHAGDLTALSTNTESVRGHELTNLIQVRIGYNPILARIGINPI